MKKKVAIILMIITVILLVITLSCKKEPLYQNGGVVDNPIDSTSKTKEPTLCETAWVLTYMQKGFSSEKPNDTIYFNYDYTFVVNNITTHDNRRFTLVKTMDIGNPYTLTLMGFSLFGGNGYWKGTVPNTFIDDGIIELCEFTSSSTSTTVRATFKRIK
jgi:hypothetical protein